jgi:redox-sensitive bicupin YhaK (pirin superfamily)
MPAPRVSIFSAFRSIHVSLSYVSLSYNTEHSSPAPPPTHTHNHTQSHWVGDGFHVHPVLADMAFTKAPSPFLMFDYAKPEHFPPTKKRLGVGEHPHRGFETVTIAFQGEVEHGDSMGNSGVIKAGDVQWMTASRGIIHNEYHSDAFAKEGGLFEMAQIWVNLPVSPLVSSVDPSRPSVRRARALSHTLTHSLTHSLVRAQMGVLMC